MSRRAVPATPPQEADPRRVVQAAVQSRQFAPAYYLFGDDDYLKDAAVRELLDAAIDPATRDFNCEVRHGDALEAEGLGSLLGTPPMLAERRALVVRDVGALKKAPMAELERYLKRPASDLLLLLVSQAGDKPSEVLKGAAVALEFAPLPPERVRRWIAWHAGQALGASVTDEAAALLQQAVGSDLQQLAGELDKCASYAQGAGSTEIDAAAVSAVVGVRPGETLADLLDAVAMREGARAAALVAPVLAGARMSGVQAVMALGTQGLALAFARARRDAGMSVHELPKALYAYLKQVGGGLTGRPWGEAVSAWTRAADRWTAAECATALERLLEADQALKESTVSSEVQLVETLVLSLGVRARGRAGGGGRSVAGASR